MAVSPLPLLRSFLMMGITFINQCYESIEEQELTMIKLTTLSAIALLFSLFAVDAWAGTPAEAMDASTRSSKASVQLSLGELQNPSIFSGMAAFEVESPVEVLPINSAAEDGLIQNGYRRRRVLVRRRYMPTRVVIVEKRPITVLARHRVQQYDNSPIYALPPQQRRSNVSIGIRFSALSLGDTDMRYETFEGASMVGIGGYLRGRVDPHWGVEFSVDALGGDELNYSHVMVPVMASLMPHLFPESNLDIYGIAGVGIVFNSVEYNGFGTVGLDEHFTLGAGQLGTGLEMSLGGLQLTTDVRWLFMESRPERDIVDLSASKSRSTGAASNTQLDSFTHGLQFTLGIGGKF